MREHVNSENMAKDFLEYMDRERAKACEKGGRLPVATRIGSPGGQGRFRTSTPNQTSPTTHTTRRTNEQA